MANYNNQVKDEEKDIIWISDFQGMNHRQDLDKIPTGSSPLLMNISSDKPGSWAKRKGSLRLGSTQAGNGVYGLIDYTKNDSTHVLRAVRSADLDVYSEGGDSWSQIVGAGFTASTKVQSTVFKNRAYHVSTADYLAYENGGALTVVGSGSDRIRGNAIAVAQNTMYITDSANPDRIYYTQYDLSNNVPSDTIWKFDAGETSKATSTNFFSVIGPCTGLFAYAGVMIAFSETKAYSFDLKYADNAAGINELFTIGLANPRAICQVNGIMVWMSPDKRIWAWGGTGQPKDISWDIEDDANGEAVIEAIASANVINVCAGSIRNKFRFSVGDVTLFGTTYTNVVIRGTINQDASGVLWGLEKYPVKPVIFANMKLGSEDCLVFGASGVDDVYKLDTGTDDSSTAIDSFGVTKFIDFGEVFSTKDSDRLYIKFRPQRINTETYLFIKYAIDGKFSYSTITDPDNGTNNYGIVNMYRDGVSTNLDEVLWVNMPTGINFRSISIMVGNSQSGEGYTVSAIGFRTAIRPLDVNIE